MTFHDPFFIQKGAIYALPIIHYNMEMASQVKLACDQLQPDCIAVELPESLQDYMLRAASRLPDLSVVATVDGGEHPLYFLCEPCDPAFEGLRSALEKNIPAHCIDLDVFDYPLIRDPIPDPYAIHRLGLKTYYELYQKFMNEQQLVSTRLDRERETYMARRLKELSFRYDRILFISGISHVASVLKLVDSPSFFPLYHAERDMVELCSLTSESCREVMAEWGYLTIKYEEHRNLIKQEGPLDRQKVILQLYREASDKYIQLTGNSFPGYHLRNTMKFVRNYALTTHRLMPSLFQILQAAKGCVDHNYAYATWESATAYPYKKNIDNLPELHLSAEEVWGNSKVIRFHMKEKSRKQNFMERLKKSRSNIRFRPPLPFSICSYPPEDIAIERFGGFLKKKGSQILTEEAARSIPFSTSLEDGIDTRETIRHWHEHQLYVKAKGKPPAGVGSICVIFNEDKRDESQVFQEKYPWKMTWIGEHQQESDMCFYATHPINHVVGPGISRCEYGGFMMSYPPRRLTDIWSDSDYQECQTKAEVLLMSAIDFAIKPVIVYVASQPPRSFMKSFARRFGKKIVYIPIGQLSPITLNKLRVFHVLEGHDKREIADEYIY